MLACLVSHDNTASVYRQKNKTMRTIRLVYVFALSIVASVVPQIAAQIQTEVPPPVAGAKPVTVEHIKIHGAALEGNLEGTRSIAMFLSFSRPVTRRRNRAAIRLFTHCTGTPSVRSNGLTRSMCRRQSKELSLKAQKR